MSAITIITICVIAILTVVIFALTGLGYHSVYAYYKLELSQGLHDNELIKEHRSKRKHKVSGIIGTIVSYTALTLLVSLFTVGVIYKVNNKIPTFNNQTALVIRSDSMKEFYSAETDFDNKYQFELGDIIFCRTDFTDLVIGDVYGYKYKSIIITHRLISYNEDTGVAVFKGDANPSADPAVLREQIVYHYTGDKIKGFGAFILYAQSYFGLWSIIGITTVAIGSEWTLLAIDNANKKRLQYIGVIHEK